jgi:pyranose oxidase
MEREEFGGAAGETVDVLIVGSGPTGSTYAREVADLLPNARILMVEAGPRLNGHVGINARNLPPEERSRAEAASEGFVHRSGERNPVVFARPGTRLVSAYEPGGSTQDDMPGAALSTNVGGMGAHWTCACPEPRGSERIGFIDAGIMADAFNRARELLHVTAEGFPETETAVAIREALSQRYDSVREAEQRIQPMPLACVPREGAMPVWSGTDRILGDLGSAGPESRFDLRDQTVCVRLFVDGSQVTGAEMRDLRNGRQYSVRAGAVVVAADSFRTPQLLWASGIRPAALGRYLNDQPKVVSVIAIDPSKVGVKNTQVAADAHLDDNRDQLTGVIWIPFDDEHHPFHGQVMQIETAPIAMDGIQRNDNQHLVQFGWFVPKEPMADDRVVFSDSELDEYGLPKMSIHYRLTTVDERNVAAAISDLDAAVQVLGDYVPGGGAQLLPAGASLHYQGSYRMGQTDDEQSVCDSNSQVWGMSNLYLAGNGLIPTSTACNPTLTSVALAVLGARHLAAAARS